MQHGQNQRWDNITLTLHNNLGNLLPSTVSSTEILEARLSSKPASGWHTHPVPHPSSSLQQHVSQHLQTQHTILDIEGNRGSSLLGTGSKFSFSTVEESCETNPLLQGTVIQIFGNSPLNQISNPEYSPYVTSKRTPKSTEILRNSYAKTIYSGLSFSSFSLSVYDIWVNIITGDISVSLQNLFYTFITQYQHSRHALFSPCNVFFNIFKFFSFIEFNPYALQYLEYALCPM